MSISKAGRYFFPISSFRRHFAALLLFSATTAVASLDVAPDYAVKDTVDRLEAFSCVPRLTRSLGPTAYGDLRAVLMAEVPEEERKRCRVPKWLILERDVGLLPVKPNAVSMSALVLGDDSVALAGLEAAVTPAYPFRGGRPTFVGPNLYTEFAVGVAGGHSEGLSLAAAITPGFALALDDYRALLGRFYLQDGYVKVGYKGIELTAGRSAVTFGNAKHGSLLLSPATKPIDLLKIDVRPRNIFLGQFQFQLFLTGHTEAVAVPDTRLFGVGLSLIPWPWIELSFLQLYQIGGQGVPGIDFGDVAKMLIYLDDPTLAAKRQRSLVAQISLWGPSNRLQLYGQAFTDDSSNAISPLVGVWVPKLAVFDLRLEYILTAQHAYRSRLYPQGLVYKGTPVGSPLGGDGEGIYVDLGLLTLGNWRPTAVFAYERRQKNPAPGTATETRIGGGFDLVHRWQVMELLASARYFAISNFRYVPNDSASSVGGYVTLRYSFF